MNRGIVLACILCAASPWVVACGGGPCGQAANTLEGSIGELYDIQVDAVGARFNQTDENVTVDFKHGNDSVAKVVADVRAFAKGAAIPLSDGDVYRVTSPETNFPRTIERGSVTFDSELTVGEQVAGCFNSVFTLQNGQSRTLEGAFETTLEAGL